MSRDNGGTSLNRVGPLAWRSGTGWLMLAGGGAWRGGDMDDIHGAALGWADLDRPLAVLPTAGGSPLEAEALLEEFVDLGGPNGYVVPIFDAVGAQQLENCSLLEDAGLIVIDDGPHVVNLVRSLRASPAIDAMAQAFARGAAVLGLGAGASALGEWVGDCESSRDQAARAEPGFGWVANVIVAPHFGGIQEDDRLRHLLNLKPNCLGLGVPDGTALSLGPSGEIENVGSGQVTIVVSGLEVEV